VGQTAKKKQQKKQKINKNPKKINTVVLAPTPGASG
jgi:hypothetical protein